MLVNAVCVWRWQREKWPETDYIIHKTFNFLLLNFSEDTNEMKLSSAFLLAGAYAEETTGTVTGTETETAAVDPCSFEASTLSCEANKMMLQVPYCAITGAGFEHGSVFMGGDDEDNQNDSCAGYVFFS